VKASNLNICSFYVGYYLPYGIIKLNAYAKPIS
jgi:hypothetical protein